MTDFLNPIFEAVGEAAEPLKPAIDFMMPQPSSVGQGLDLDIGSLINSVGRGAVSAFNESVPGMAMGALGALTSEGSARQRLLMGGMALAGGALGARALHANWKATRLPQRMTAPAVSVPSGYTDLVDGLGDRPRFMDHSADAEQVLRERPGINRRQAQILASDDPLSVARGVARWKGTDSTREALTGGLFETYAARVAEGPRGAQVDWARFDIAIQKGLISAKTPANKRVRELWKQLTETPEKMDEAAADELFGYLKSFGDEAQIVPFDDLSMGMVGRVSAVDFVDGRAEVFVSQPYGWNDGMTVDPAVRALRLSQLNPRAVAEHGARMIEHLYLLGKQQYDQYQTTGTTTLPTPPDVGDQWYYRAGPAVAEEFKLDPTIDFGEYKKAVATVSFLSEAELWETNIAKAHRVLTALGDVSDADFQEFLRVGPRKYTGATPVAALEQRFADTWDFVKKGAGDKSSGIKVSSDSMKKVLRLQGGLETPEQVFASTQARKQKNFYLNILYPDLDWPTTVDRHAYDIFWGIDAGIQDRPVDGSMFDGDQQYDVIADTIRAVAAKYGVRPHEVQAAGWEAWRALKSAHGRSGWERKAENGAISPDPFMVVLPGETGNPVYEALMGRAGSSGDLAASPTGAMPVTLLEAHDLQGLSAATVGDQTVLVSSIDDFSSTVARTKTPGVIGDDGLARWVDSKPLPVKDLNRWLQTVEVDNADVEVTLAASHPGGVHPLFRPEPTIVGYTDDPKFRAPKGMQAADAGNAARYKTELVYEKLGADDIDPDSWRSPDSPLNTHAWAAIAAELTPEQAARLGIDAHDNVAATNRLRAELLKRGYKPIDQEGYYGSETPEVSFLVFGITPAEALTIGEKFGQDAVITNDGFLYNRKVTNDPDAVGRRQVATGMELDPVMDPNGDPLDYFRSELVIGDKRLKWRQELDWNDMPEQGELDLMGRRQATRRHRIEVAVKPGEDLVDAAERLERAGLTDLSVYAPTDSLPGFERAYETAVFDGHSYGVTRTKSGNVNARNGSHVFTRSTGALPEEVPASTPSWSVSGDGVAVAGNSLLVDGRFPNGNVEFTGPFQAKLGGKRPVGWGYTQGTLIPVFDKAELNSGRFEATIVKNAVIPGDVNDIGPAILAAQHLEAAGWPGTLTMNGTHTFGEPEFTDHAVKTVVTRNGLVQPKPHPDVPTRAADRYGVPFYVGWMQDGKMHRLDEATTSSVESGLALVMADFGDVVHRTRLRGITTENMRPEDWVKEEVPPFAYMGFASDQYIVLNREYFSNPERLAAQIQEARHPDVMLLSTRVEPTPRSIVVHELGHVLHLSARMGERMGKVSDLDKEIRALGGRGWKKVAAKEISMTASMDVSELIAESVSEVLLSDAPSRLAQDVFDVLTNRLGAYMKYRNLGATGTDGLAAAPARPVSIQDPPKKAAPAAAALAEPVTDPKYWGGGMDAMFPSGALSTPAPFPSAGKSKKLQAYDKKLVEAAVAAGETTTIDPRSLYTMQPSVTQDGVRHYFEGDGRNGALFADAEQAGNKHPVIYRRDEGNGRVRNLILSGNHRAAAALAAGEQLTAIVVDGPWGPPR